MTGIQALERLAPDFPPLRPGIWHANFDVATGQVICPTCGDTRTEVDFAAHVRVESEPDAKRDLITDCLNTHQSESLVRLVAEIEGLEFDLGIKGESGILKSMKTRAASDQRVVYTPNILLGSIKLKFGLAFWYVSYSSVLVSSAKRPESLISSITLTEQWLNLLSGLIKVRYWQFNGKAFDAVLYFFQSHPESTDDDLLFELCA